MCDALLSILLPQSTFPIICTVCGLSIFILSSLYVRRLNRAFRRKIQYYLLQNKKIPSPYLAMFWMKKIARNIIYTLKISKETSRIDFVNKEKQEVYSIIIEMENSRYVDIASRFNYYRFLREEIKREDEITHQRLTWMITFQGFMISAVTVLISFAWPNCSVGQICTDIDSVIGIRKISLGAIPIIGLAFGHIAHMGIIASRRSISASKYAWELRNKQWKLYPHYVPQTYGRGGHYKGGALYPVYISLMFIFMWQIYFAVYMSYEQTFWIEIMKNLKNYIISNI